MPGGSPKVDEPWTRLNLVCHLPTLRQECPIYPTNSLSSTFSPNSLSHERKWREISHFISVNNGFLKTVFPSIYIWNVPYDGDTIEGVNDPS